MKHKYLVSLIGAGLGFWQFYLAIGTSEGKVELILRVVAALIWLSLAYLILIERKITKEQRMVNWYKKVKPKGMSYHLFKWTFGWGLFFGINSFITQVDFKIEADNLLLYGITLVVYLATGFIFGVIFWRKNKKDAQRLRLNEN